MSGRPEGRDPESCALISGRSPGSAAMNPESALFHCFPAIETLQADARVLSRFLYFTVAYRARQFEIHSIIPFCIISSSNKRELHPPVYQSRLSRWNLHFYNSTVVPDIANATLGVRYPGRYEPAFVPLHIYFVPAARA